VTVTEIMGSETMTAAAYGVTMERVREAMSAHCMATPPMTHVCQATMEPTAVPATSPTMKPGKSTAVDPPRQHVGDHGRAVTVGANPTGHLSGNSRNVRRRRYGL
jgi:hypothetical protein